MARKSAAQRDAEAAVHEYDDVYLMCRDLRHVWRLVGFYRQNGTIHRVLDCERCTTQRADVWRPSGERVRSNYVYVDGYKLEGVNVDLSDVRREVMSRATVFPSETDMVAALTNGSKRKRVAKR